METPGGRGSNDSWQLVIIYELIGERSVMVMECDGGGGEGDGIMMLIVKT